MSDGPSGYFSKSNWGFNTRKYVAIVKTIKNSRWTDILVATQGYTLFKVASTSDAEANAADENEYQAPESGTFFISACAHFGILNIYSDPF
jgi:hypothetical protein